MRHETAIFGTKKQIQKFQLSCYLAFFLSLNNKNTKNAETPIFIVFQST